MKISSTQENLNQGLLICSHIANKNANLPILANILITSKDKILILSATNLEIGVSVNIRSKVEEEGEFSVEAKLLSDFISLLPKERVDLNFDGSDLNIKCGKQKTKIKSQIATDFPLIPKIEKKNPYLIKSKDFKQAILEVIFAVSSLETRPEFSGVYMKINQKELILAATDSYRLAERKIKLSEENNQGEKEVIIPAKTLQEISRILGVFKDDLTLENIENVEIYLTENQIMFSYNGVDLISRLIEGQYPDYTQIIPTSHQTDIKTNNSDLIKAVKTSSLFTKSGVYDVKIEFKTKEKEAVLTSSSSQVGENISILEAEIVGVDNNIVLNHRYLLDGLLNINSELVEIEMTDSNSPCLIRPNGSKQYTYIIMPIRQ
ncbi:MAG: DNA polymerase III subunit beta [Patescibacteria group bacterium]